MAGFIDVSYHGRDLLYFGFLHHMVEIISPSNEEEPLGSPFATPHAILDTIRTETSGTFMDEYIEQLSENRKREQVVITAVLLAWYDQEDTELAVLYRTDLKKAFERSNELLLHLKTQFAQTAQQFGIPDKVFLRLGIRGDHDERSAQIDRYFQRAFTILGITDIHEQNRLICSGLGIPHLRLCLIAYEIDWNKPFVAHEYLHILLPGIDDNLFFDEVMTEILAYEECGFFDRDTLSLTSKQDLIDAGVDVVYYDHVQLFLDVVMIIPHIFTLTERAYRTGDKKIMAEIKDSIDEHFSPGSFEILTKTDPFEYDEDVLEQPWLHVDQARKALNLVQISQ